MNATVLNFSAPAVTANAKRPRWDAGDWLKIVARIDADYPELNISTTCTVQNIKSSYVREAMKSVIDHWRHRTTFNTTLMRPSLEQALKDYRLSLAEAKVAAEKRAVEAAAAPKASTASDYPAMDPYDAAFKPLVDMIAAEVMRRQQPQLDRIEDMLRRLMQTNATPLEHQMYEGAPHPTMPSASQPITLRRPKVGLVGMMSVQVQSLEKSYPHIHFVAVESTTETDVLKKVLHCDRVLGLVRFAKKMDTHLRKHIPARYTSVNGTIGEAKRLIDMMLNTGAIPQHPAH